MILFCNEISVIKSIGRGKEVDLKRNHRKKVVYGKGHYSCLKRKTIHDLYKLQRRNGWWFMQRGELKCTFFTFLRAIIHFCLQEIYMGIWNFVRHYIKYIFCYLLVSLLLHIAC